MSPDNASEPAPLGEEEWRKAEEKVLARAREIARRISERIRKATEDTQIDMALPGEPTAEHIPLES